MYSKDITNKIYTTIFETVKINQKVKSTLFKQVL